jgi:hypothetical protein
MTNFRKYTGSSIDFEYRALANLEPEVVESYCGSLRRRFKTKAISLEAVEEWLVRTYSAVKLILSATVMVSSAEYASERALRIVEPYLFYYSLLNSSRALLVLVPEQPWNDAKLLDETTHMKILNITADQIRHLSNDTSEEYADLMRRALVSRELFSYKFPGQGLKGQVSRILPAFDQVLDMCSYLAEMAQLHSECLEAAFLDTGGPHQDFTEETLRRFFEYEHKFLAAPLEDDDDYYRLGYTLRKLGRPVSLQVTATEGLVEDFFGAWDFASDGTDDYRPKPPDWGMIFPFM